LAQGLASLPAASLSPSGARALLMEGSRYQGTVKAFRGSFGWLSCSEVAEKCGGRDTFLHKNVLNTIPVVGSTVDFCLNFDAKGNPKASEAKLVSSASDADVAVKKGKGAAGKTKTETRAQVVKRASLLIIRKDEVLVVKELKDGGKLRWSDIGGKLEAGEAYLDCALRELAEEAQCFLSAESIRLLETGLRHRYGDGGAEPELVGLGPSGGGTQAAAVFEIHVEGVDLELLKPGAPNKHGVHEMCWLGQGHPDLRSSKLTRWPLLRSLCVLLRPAAAAAAKQEEEDEEGEESEEEEGREEKEGDRARSRSRSPRCG